MPDLATAVTVIDACGRARVPVLLLSDPGMGKSSLIRAIASADGLACETVLGSIREPADVAGLPLLTEGGMVLEPPAWAKPLVEAGTGYLFLDLAKPVCVSYAEGGCLASFIRLADSGGGRAGTHPIAPPGGQGGPGPLRGPI